MAGTLTPQLLDEKLDENGTCFNDAATAVGYGGKSHKVGQQMHQYTHSLHADVLNASKITIPVFKTVRSSLFLARSEFCLALYSVMDVQKYITHQCLGNMCIHDKNVV